MLVVCDFVCLSYSLVTYIRYVKLFQLCNIFYRSTVSCLFADHFLHMDVDLTTTLTQLRGIMHNAARTLDIQEMLCLWRKSIF